MKKFLLLLKGVSVEDTPEEGRTGRSSLQGDGASGLRNGGRRMIKEL